MEDFIAFVIGGMLGFVIGCLVVGIPAAKDENKFKVAAIQHGYAEYVIIDAETGKTEWRWIEKGSE